MSIFVKGKKFCLRGDQMCTPVDWHWFENAAEAYPVMYVAGGIIRSCTLEGQFCRATGQSEFDLIPVPELVPWNNRKDVPHGIFIRRRGCTTAYVITGYATGGIEIGTLAVTFLTLFQCYEYHNDRDAENGWRQCGKAAP